MQSGGSKGAGTSRTCKYNIKEGTKVSWSICLVDNGKIVHCMAQSVASTA